MDTIEIDCRKCTNLHPNGNKCRKYGPNAGKATAACARDKFINYIPKDAPPAEIKPGETVWIIARDVDNTAVEVVGYVLLAKVEGMVICSPKIEDYELDGILAYHAERTADEEETSLCIFPDEDCYAKKVDAVADFVMETGA